ncbi:MAG: helix-turn-helix transcriptional regulator [Mucilaginibacter sp.]|nr:helix-turn-helix transcriptional regulator [Mucilaginibacter sp.]
MKNSISHRVSQVLTNIRIVRERRNYTQDYLAMKMNISQNAYSKIELGNSKLCVIKLLEICEILEIPFVDMIDPCIRKVSYRLDDRSVIYGDLYRQKAGQDVESDVALP